MVVTATADEVVAELHGECSTDALIAVRKRLAPDEDAFGVRMGTLFAVAKRHTGLPLTEVVHLLGHPAFEPRMAAMCILDFKARRKRPGDHERGTLARTYLGLHDRITTWDMVDRAAPRVVGLWLVGCDKHLLHDLAGSPDPLRRRTAMTAPLGFLGTDDLGAGFELAALLAADPDPLVHKPVGIFLKHASAHDLARVTAFLDEHAGEMRRPAVRLAVERLAPGARSRWV